MTWVTWRLQRLEALLGGAPPARQSGRAARLAAVLWLALTLAACTQAAGSQAGAATSPTAPTEAPGPGEPLSYAGGPLSSWTAGQFASIRLRAAGGTPPYTWKAKAGTHLPAGLSLSIDGVLSGTPAPLPADTSERIAPPFTVVLTDADARHVDIVLHVVIVSPTVPGAAAGGPDPVYYTLSAALILILLLTIRLGLAIRRKLVDSLCRRLALGMSLAAGGFAISVIAGVTLDSMADDLIISDLLYQQAHFLIIYGGFILVLYGIDAVVMAARDPVPLPGDARRWRLISAATWTAYVVAIGISASFLFNRASYTITRVGDRTIAAQQTVFFLPLFVVLIAGVIGSLVALAVALKFRKPALQRHLVWFVLFVVLLSIGVLREATLIPSFGLKYPAIVAFGPFTLGGLCLYMSAKALPRG